MFAPNIRPVPENASAAKSTGWCLPVRHIFMGKPDTVLQHLQPNHPFAAFVLWVAD